MRHLFDRSQHVRYRCFDSWESAAAFLKNEKGCDLCGIVAQAPSRHALSPGSRTVSECKLGPSGTAVSTDVAVKDAPHGTEGVGASGRSTPSTTGAHSVGKTAPLVGDSPGVSQPSQLRSSAHMSSSLSLSEGEREGEDGRDLDANVPSAGGMSRRGGHAEGRNLTSTAVRRRPFRRSTAFLVGHRNRLGEEALNVCDFLVHVEQQVREKRCQLNYWMCSSPQREDAEIQSKKHRLC